MNQTFAQTVSGMGSTCHRFRHRLTPVKQGALPGRLRAVLLVCGGLLLAACGGGGGSSGAGSTPTTTISGTAPAPAAGPGDTSVLFPMALGSSWDYDVQETQTATFDVFGLARIAVTGTTSVAGVSATKFATSSNVSDVGGFDQFYTASNGGVTFYGSDDPGDLVTNLITPTPQLLFPVSTGTISTVLATGVSVGTSGGDALSANFTQQVSVVGTESVTVGAGVFPNAVKVSTTTTGTVSDAVTHQTVAINAVDTSWFAPGVGLAQETSTGGVDATVLSRTISARGYKIGGIAHGLGNPTVIASGVAPSGSVGQSASSGSNILVLSSVNNAATAYLIGNDGTLAATVGLAGFVPPLLAFDGSNYVAASYAQNPADSGNFDLTLQRLSPNGTLLDPSPGLFISSFANIQSATPIGIGGGNNRSLIVFTKDEPQAFNSQQHLFGMLVDGNGNGNPSSTQGFPIQATGNPASAVVVFDGTNFLVVWKAAGGIYLTRVTANGAVLDPAPVLLSSGIFTTGPAVAFDGTNFLVVWGDTASSTSGNMAIYGRRVSTSGALLEGPPGTGALQLSAGAQTNLLGPVVAFNGVEYLVAWQGATGVKGARLTPAGVTTSGAGYEIQISDRGSSASGPLTANSGPAPQLTWLTFGNGNGNFTLMSSIIRPF